MNKKAQSGLEFMMTYGWAILVVMIAIGALSYFFVFNPNNTAPDVCLLPVGFICRDSSISATNGVLLVVENGLKKSLSSFTITIPECFSTATASGGLSYPETERLNMSCSSGNITAGDKVKFSLEINYTSGSGAQVITHSIDGTLVGIVEE